MKPYMVIEGTGQAIDLFEQKVAKALEMGYTLAGELIAQLHTTEIKLFQPVILEDEQDEWDEDEEDEEEDEA